MRKLFSLFLALVATTSLWAHNFSVNGIYYNYLDGNNVEVTYRGNDYNSNYYEYAGEVIIPSTVTYNGTTYSVTSIGDWAFSDCSSLTSITIPNSVTSIGNFAFYYCSSLTSITIPNSVTSIGDGAFYACSKLTSITIPNSVTSIEDDAFNGCSSLTSVTIGNSVTNIGDDAFAYCSSLTSITIPNSVTNIGDGAFFYCTSLTSVTIPESVTIIGRLAFCYCSSLTSITIPNSVMSIGDEAFHGCSSLTSVTIGNSVTSIGDGAFYGCYSLTSITIPNKVTSIGYEAFRGCYSLTSVTIPNSVTSIGDRAFGWCESLTSITIPNSVTNIGANAFYGCSGLTSITCEAETPPTVGQYAFDGVSESIPVYVPCGCVEAYKAANGWKNFTNIQEPLAEYSIEVYVNDNIMGTANVDINNGCGAQISAKPTFGYHFVQWSDRNIDNPRTLVLTKDTILTAEFTLTQSGQCGDNLYWELIDDTLHITGTGAMYDYTYDAPWKRSIKVLRIGECVTSIGNHAFYGCSSLTSITIPNSVTSIGEYAFSGCSSLTSITIPNSITSIGSYAFEGCSALTSVTINSYAIVNKQYSSYSNLSHIFGSQVTEYVIGDNVIGIGESAFNGCSSLLSVTIPASVTSIGSGAFYGCFELTKTNYTGDIASWCNIKFGSYSANPMYYSHNFYINDQEIKDLVIPNSVTSIGGSAFYGCSSLTSVTIGNSVTSIGEEAFNGCSSLTKTNYIGDIAGWCNIKFGNPDANPMSYSRNFYINDQEIKDLVIPNSVTSIGSYAFEGCSSLLSVTIPNSVTSIGEWAFYFCSGLTSVTIPNSVTSIGGCAFFGCSSLTSVTIGESVTSIGEWAFSGCSALTSVTIPNSVTSIERYAFEGCSALTSVTIGNSVTSIGSGAFNKCSSLTSITCEAETPPTIGYAYTFYDVSTSIPVYVPCGCVEAYKAASGWSDFTNIQGPLAEYSIEVYVNDTIMGTAKVNYNTFCEGNQISAKPNFGYHFVQWSDGNTDAIRTLELTQDTILTAEFAQPFSGQCGDNLYWSYNESDQTISITGSGKMYDYTASTQPWLLFKEEIKEVIIANTATSIGTSAFEGCIRLGKISLGTRLKNIAANAFAGCTRLYDIYVYATYPPFAEESSFANYNVYLYVPCENQRDYILDIVWGKFKFIECLGAESEPVALDTVIVTPGSTDVTITWPTEEGADTYTIVIKKDGEVVCTLTFNAEGQLINIAFAPGRNGNHPAQYAEAVANGKGFRFTVTGLEDGTHYTYNIDVKNTADQTINSHSGEFTTQSTTAVDNITTTTANIQKILRDGQLLILRDGVEYNAMGQEL